MDDHRDRVALRLPCVRPPHRAVELLRLLRVLRVLRVVDWVEWVRRVADRRNHRERALRELVVDFHLAVLPVVQVVQLPRRALRGVQPAPPIRVVHELALLRVRVVEVHEVLPGVQTRRERDGAHDDVEEVPQLAVAVVPLLVLPRPPVGLPEPPVAPLTEEVLQGLRRGDARHLRVQRLLKEAEELDADARVEHDLELGKRVEQRGEELRLRRRRTAHELGVRGHRVEEVLRRACVGQLVVVVGPVHL